ncbi:hypothetical protein D3C81_2190580 [compost metagenome]
MSSLRRGDRARVAVILYGRRLELDRPVGDPLTALAPGAPVRLHPRRFHVLAKSA